MKSKKEQLISLLDSVRFWKLENYRAGASLVVLLDLFDENQYEYLNLWNVPICQDNYHVTRKSGKVLFLYSNSYRGHKRHEESFGKVTDLLERKVVVMPDRGGSRKEFTISEKALMGIWFMQMRSISLSVKKKLFFVNLLMSGKRNLEKLIPIIEENRIRSVVTLADVHLIDSLVTTYCNQHGIKTATLQHGFFPAGDYFYRYSRSRYFLTYGEYTKKLAKECKKYKGILLPVGMPEFINEEKIMTRNKKEREKFLVCLNGRIQKEHIANKEMLKICTEYAEKSNCFFEVKAHPSSTSEYLQEYKKIIGKRGKFVGGETRELDLFDNYTFCVANGTTMILKAIFVLTPVLFFCQKREDSFLKLNQFWSAFDKVLFTNCVEMQGGSRYISKNNIEDDLIRIREYLCGSGKIAQNYLEFLNKL